MKRFIPINQIIFELKSRKALFDKLTFFNIFLIWAGAIFTFGFMYHFFHGSYSYLLYQTKNQTVTSLLDSIYFSFITATTTGFGDIVPLGYFKFIALLEVISGLLLLAVVTSKLVSIKQDMILGEIYELSFNERINRLRSSMMLFRQNLSKIINKIEESLIKKRELGDIYIYISNFEDILNEILSLVDRKNKRIFTKEIDPLNAELIYNSILQSFDKLYELVKTMNNSKLEWKRDITVYLIKRCILLNENLFDKLLSIKILEEKNFRDLELQKNEITDKIKNEMAAVKSQEQKADETK